MMSGRGCRVRARGLEEDWMNRLLIAIVLIGMAGSAWAQTTPAPQAAQTYKPYDESRFYVAGMAGVTFGNKTSSTFGVEAGMKMGDILEVFAEGGRMTDVTTGGTDTAAAAIGSFLGTLGRGSATWSVKTPANYGAIGARYLFPASGKFEPYVAATVGIANVDKQVAFALNGSDVTGSLPSLGVQLGKDLAGKTNNALFMLGGGVRMPFGAVLVDVGARYGRIFTDPAGTNLFRLTAAVGYRF
jgi:hypothetical protein